MAKGTQFEGTSRMRIAVVGTGITGMAAAWMLHRAGHELVVYEQESRIGGHSNTVEAPFEGGVRVPVDTGFIVYNNVTYPNLVKLFEHLKVPVKDSDMSFAVSAGDGRLEYGGDTLNSLFGQRRNLLRPSHYAMLRDVLRFYREAPDLLRAEEDEAQQTLGDYLRDRRYSHAFVYNHLLPMGAAIWSTTIREMMGFPARSFVRFFENHGLMKLSDRPVWRTVDGGSRAYVERLTAPFQDRIRRDCAAVEIRRTDDGAVVRDATGQIERFDEVVVATHGDQALALLGDADRHERAVLGAFRTTANSVVLHTDTRLMPKRRRVWASWNYLTAADGAEAGVSVTYWMNRLQGLQTPQPLFVSLNPVRDPAPGTDIARLTYDHPLFDTAAITAQEALPTIQGRRHVWFCGAHCGYGFHEDGLSAGLAVAEALGARRPWTVTDASPAGRNATPDAPRLPRRPSVPAVAAE